MAIVKKNGNATPTFRSIFSDLLDTDNFFSSFLNDDWAQVPAVNVKEKEKSFEIELASPGLRKEDFHVSVDNGILTISAEKEESKNEEKENYTRKEFSYNSFSRSFSLPETVKQDNVQAKYENGVLKLSLDKKETAVSKSKRVEVK